MWRSFDPSCSFGTGFPSVSPDCPVAWGEQVPNAWQLCGLGGDVSCGTESFKLTKGALELSRGDPKALEQSTGIDEVMRLAQ